MSMNWSLEPDNRQPGIGLTSAEAAKRTVLAAGVKKIAGHKMNGQPTVKHSDNQARSPSLKICLEFFEYLNQRKIRYCHWKSNSHLDQALAGETDLDLLVHPEDKNHFEQSLIAFDCKEMIAPPHKRYPGITDWLGFDWEKGKLIHLHVHYQLIIGQKYVKNHFLPIEELFFEHQRLLEGVLVPCPELELLLLIIRAHLKMDWWSIGIGQKTIKNTPYPSGIYLEFLWLLKDCQEHKFADILRQSQLPLSESLLMAFIERMRSNRLERQDIAHIRSHIIDKLIPYRRSPTWITRTRYLSERLKRSRYLRRFFPEPRKTLGGGGKIFAIVGADGSGKSTLTRDLCHWLSWKCAIQNYYFGIPKTLLLKSIIPKSVRLLHLLARSPLPKFCSETIGVCAQAISASRWLVIGRRRLQLFREAQRFAVAGGVAIAERYPLSAFHDMAQPMDGPRIRKEFQIRLDSFADWEEACYCRIILPTHVFVLRTSFDELRKRKGDSMGLERHREKAEAVNAIRPSLKISVINGDQAYPKVVLQIKRIIWGLL